MMVMMVVIFPNLCLEQSHWSAAAASLLLPDLPELRVRNPPSWVR